MKSCSTRWMTIANGRTNIMLGVIYVPQENKTNIGKLKEMYKDLTGQIIESKKQRQNLLLVEDFNCKVGNAIRNNTDN